MLHLQSSMHCNPEFCIQLAAGFVDQSGRVHVYLHQIVAQSDLQCQKLTLASISLQHSNAGNSIEYSFPSLNIDENAGTGHQPGHPACCQLPALVQQVVECHQVWHAQAARVRAFRAPQEPEEPALCLRMDSGPPQRLHHNRRPQHGELRILCCSIGESSSAPLPHLTPRCLCAMCEPAYVQNLVGVAPCTRGPLLHPLCIVLCACT